MMKIFFFDIDGTLAMNKEVPESNMQALKSLKDKGYLTFICSGRAPFYASKLFGDLVSGYVCCNGRYILYNNEKLHGEAFNEEELKYYLDKIKKLDAGAMLVSDDKSYLFHANDKQKETLIKEYGENHIGDESLNHPFYTFDLLYTSLDQRDALIETFKDALVINDHGGHGSTDCSTINFDKGSAIKYLLEYFDIDINDSYAFGDGYNDQAMFREAGHKIAMGNAVDVLKEKATYITANIEYEGIMKALIHENVL
ncbi:MAG: Cof-type HAD-IIB family hydrolase [Erysipelotrichaceae bacterium]|nr:Cof-type HAD-IIB family hydrolase [Erysipelotrichaceae bacterium]